MKFLPSVFRDDDGRSRFVALLRALVELGVVHAQFNVVDREELMRARERPQDHRSLTIRVAGYTAYFTELAAELQDEIIARTEFGA
jgi:formate C-acetyltransferase